MSADSKVVRFSLGGLLSCLAAALLLGLLGGYIGQKTAMPDFPPLPSSEERLVTSIQEVTISPNTATVELVERHNKSVWLIGASEASSLPLTASMVTSDGVLVTAGLTAGNSVTAMDETDKPVRVDVIGHDELYGLTFLRIQEVTAAPLDMSQNDSREGESLIALGRSVKTGHPAVHTYQVQQYSLPDATAPAGAQRLLHGPAAAEEVTAGSPLLNEEGQLAGILIDPPSGTALPASQVRASFERMAAKQLDYNPLKESGISVNYVFTRQTADTPRQFAAEVATVAADSQAALAGLKRADVITAVNGEAVEWQRSLTRQLSGTKPLTLTVWRQGEEVSIAFEPQS